MDLVSNVIISEAVGYGCTGIGTAMMVAFVFVTLR